MTWPAADVSTTDFDAGTDSPASARAALLDLATKFNELRNHVSVFVRGLLDDVDAPTARTTLGLANHEQMTVTSAGNVTIPGTLNVTGAITGAANVSAFSDERWKKNWGKLPGDLVDRLAGVRAGTFELKGSRKQLAAAGLEPGCRYVGVSAQSLQEVLPEAVQAGENGRLAVVYGNAALVAAVALAAEVVELRARLARLEGRK